MSQCRNQSERVTDVEEHRKFNETLIKPCDIRQTSVNIQPLNIYKRN